MSARRLTVLIGFCFSLGALTDTALTWRLHERDLSAEPPGAEGHAGAAPATLTAAPAAIGTIGSASMDNAVRELRSRDLELPVYGVKREELHDAYADTRGGHAHEALDIMAARGTPVLAAESGHIEKLFTSKAGGLTIYQFDPSNTFCYYYAHLDGYAQNLREGDHVDRGQVVGYVGSTGNAAENAPHLHFAIFRLTPKHEWWKGDPLNPYQVLR